MIFALNRWTGSAPRTRFRAVRLRGLKFNILPRADGRGLKFNIHNNAAPSFRKGGNSPRECRGLSGDTDLARREHQFISSSRRLIGFAMNASAENCTRERARERRKREREERGGGARGREGNERTSVTYTLIKRRRAFFAFRGLISVAVISDC